MRRSGLQYSGLMPGREQMRIAIARKQEWVEKSRMALRHAIRDLWRWFPALVRHSWGLTILRIRRLFRRPVVPSLLLREMWQQWYSFSAEYAREHQHELTEYGKLTLIELPDLIDRIYHLERSHHEHGKWHE